MAMIKPKNTTGWVVIPRNSSKETDIYISKKLLSESKIRDWYGQKIITFHMSSVLYPGYWYIETTNLKMGKHLIVAARIVGR